MTSFLSVADDFGKLKGIEYVIGMKIDLTRALALFSLNLSDHRYVVALWMKGEGPHFRFFF